MYVPFDTWARIDRSAPCTERINQLQVHFKAHKKDHHSRRG
ncbi:MAG: 30S ribosomal protein S15, partial [Myxococcota bacterium]